MHSLAYVSFIILSTIKEKGEIIGYRIGSYKYAANSNNYLDIFNVTVEEMEKLSRYVPVYYSQLNSVIDLNGVEQIDECDRNVYWGRLRNNSLYFNEPENKADIVGANVGITYFTEYGEVLRTSDSKIWRGGASGAYKLPFLGRIEQYFEYQVDESTNKNVFSLKVGDIELLELPLALYMDDYAIIGDFSKVRVLRVDDLVWQYEMTGVKSKVGLFSGKGWESLERVENLAGELIADVRDGKFVKTYQKGDKVVMGLSAEDYITVDGVLDLTVLDGVESIYSSFNDIGTEIKEIKLGESLREITNSFNRVSSVGVMALPKSTCAILGSFNKANIKEIEFSNVWSGKEDGINEEGKVYGDYDNYINSPLEYRNEMKGRLYYIVDSFNGNESIQSVNLEMSGRYLALGASTLGGLREELESQQTDVSVKYSQFVPYIWMNGSFNGCINLDSVVLPKYRYMGWHSSPLKVFESFCDCGEIESILLGDVSVVKDSFVGSKIKHLEVSSFYKRGYSKAQEKIGNTNLVFQITGQSKGSQLYIEKMLIKGCEGCKEHLGYIILSGSFIVSTFEFDNNHTGVVVDVDNKVRINNLKSGSAYTKIREKNGVLSIDLEGNENRKQMLFVKLHNMAMNIQPKLVNNRLDETTIGVLDLRDADIEKIHKLGRRKLSEKGSRCLNEYEIHDSWIACQAHVLLLPEKLKEVRGTILTTDVALRVDYIYRTEAKTSIGWLYCPKEMDADTVFYKSIKSKELVLGVYADSIALRQCKQHGLNYVVIGSAEEFLEYIQQQENTDELASLIGKNDRYLALHREELEKHDMLNEFLSCRLPTEREYIAKAVDRAEYIRHPLKDAVVGKEFIVPNNACKIPHTMVYQNPAVDKDLVFPEHIVADMIFTEILAVDRVGERYWNYLRNLAETFFEEVTDTDYVLELLEIDKSQNDRVLNTHSGVFRYMSATQLLSLDVRDQKKVYLLQPYKHIERQPMLLVFVQGDDFIAKVYACTSKGRAFHNWLLKRSEAEEELNRGKSYIMLEKEQRLSDILHKGDHVIVRYEQYKFNENYGWGHWAYLLHYEHKSGITHKNSLINQQLIRHFEWGVLVYSEVKKKQKKYKSKFGNISADFTGTEKSVYQQEVWVVSKADFKLFKYKIWAEMLIEHPITLEKLKKVLEIEVLDVFDKEDWLATKDKSVVFNSTFYSATYEEVKKDFEFGEKYYQNGIYGLIDETTGHRRSTQLFKESYEVELAKKLYPLLKPDEVFVDGAYGVCDLHEVYKRLGHTDFKYIVSLVEQTVFYSEETQIQTLRDWCSGIGVGEKGINAERYSEIDVGYRNNCHISDIQVRALSSRGVTTANLSVLLNMQNRLYKDETLNAWKAMSKSSFLTPYKPITQFDRQRISQIGGKWNESANQYYLASREVRHRTGIVEWGQVYRIGSDSLQNIINKLYNLGRTLTKKKQGINADGTPYKEGAVVFVHTIFEESQGVLLESKTATEDARVRHFPSDVLREFTDVLCEIREREDTILQTLGLKVGVDVDTEVVGIYAVYKESTKHKGEVERSAKVLEFDTMSDCAEFVRRFMTPEELAGMEVVDIALESSDIVHSYRGMMRMAATRVLAESLIQKAPKASFEKLRGWYGSYDVLDMGHKEDRLIRTGGSPDGEVDEVLRELVAWYLLGRASALTRPADTFIIDIHEAYLLGLDDTEVAKLGIKATDWDLIRKN